MTLSQNQFNQSPVQGEIDLKTSTGQTVSCQISTTSAGGLVAGQAVKVVDVVGGVPRVVEAAIDTDDIFGFINYDIKSVTYEVNDKADVSFFRGACMYMTAGAAVARWAKLQVVIATKKIITHAGGGQRVIGRAYDKAAADGDLIRVIIDLPGATS